MSSDPLRCPKGHQLLRDASADRIWVHCDAPCCSAGWVDPNQACWTCDQCDYDVCQRCVEAAIAPISWHSANRPAASTPLPQSPRPRPPTPDTEEAGGAAADSEEVEQEEQEGQDADDEAEAEEPQKKKEKKKKKLRRRTIAKPDASVEWQAERAMLAAREAQVIYDGMGWTLRVGSVRLCDV